MGKRNLGQRIGAPDMRPELSTFEQGAQFIELAAILSCEHEVIPGILAPRVDEVLWLRDIDDRDKAAKLGERARTAGVGVATDRVEDNVDATASCFAHHGFDMVFGLVVDDDIGSHAACELEIRLADSGDYPCTHGLRKQDRHMSYRLRRRAPDEFGEGTDGFPVSLAVDPLTDALDFDQNNSLQGCKIVGNRRLRQAKTLCHSV